MITTRSAHTGDGAFLVRSTRELARSHDVLDHCVGTAADYDEALSHSSPIIGAVLAFVDVDFAGAAVWHRSYSTNRGKEVMYLEDLCVLPEFRRRGIAKALMTSVCAVAQQRGYPSIYWMAMGSNVAALKFYEEIGASIERDTVICRLNQDALSVLANR